MINSEVMESENIKIFVESDFNKKALEKYTINLELLANKKIEVEVK